MIRPAAAWFASDEARDAMTPGPRAPVRPRAPGRDRGGDRARRVAAPAATSRSGRARPRCASACEEELEPETARRRLGLVPQLVVHLLPGAHRRRAHARRARDLLARAAAACSAPRSCAWWRSSPTSRRSPSSDRAAGPRGAPRARGARAQRGGPRRQRLARARRRLRGDRRAGAPARRREQGRAAALRAGDGRPAHRRGDRLHRRGRAHALPRGRGHDRPGRAHRGVLRERSGRRRSLRARVRRARGHRLLRPRPHRARAAPVRRAHRQPRAARLLRRRASSRASRRWRRPPPAPSPTRSTSTASAASPPRSRAGSSPRGASDVPGFELGLVYEPAGHDVGGGDIFGVWTLPSGALAVLVGDVTGKGLEVAALSAMVRFFVEARTWDSERPGEVLAQTDRLLGGRLPSASFVTAFMGVIADGTLRWANAGHAPPVAPAPRRRGGAQGHRRAARRGGRRRATRSTRRPSGPATCSSPRPTGSSRRAAAARSSASGACRPCWPSTAARWRPRELVARRLPRGRGVGAAARRRRRHARPAPAARDPPRGADRRGRRRRSSPSTSSSCASGWATPSCPPRRSSPPRTTSTARGAAWLVLYEGDAAVACGGLRPLAPGVAEIKRMFVTAAGPRPRPRPRAAGRARAARRRGRPRARAPLHDRGPARGARALQRVRLPAGRASPPIDGRIDLWLEKRLRTPAG